MEGKIIFKAKRKDNGQWVEGDLIHAPDTRMAISTMSDDGLFEVDTETVCQYTGLADACGREIWEHDIVLVYSEREWCEVLWDDDTAKFIMLGDGIEIDFDYCDALGVEIGGNSFDNAELLGGDEE